MEVLRIDNGGLNEITFSGATGMQVVQNKSKKDQL
jgi:hypothetical protein